eukprot:2233973-Pleurochrysis_carterae.AAC.1
MNRTSHRGGAGDPACSSPLRATAQRTRRWRRSWRPGEQTWWPSTSASAAGTMTWPDRRWWRRCCAG